MVKNHGPTDTNASVGGPSDHVIARDDLVEPNEVALLRASVEGPAIDAEVWRRCIAQALCAVTARAPTGELVGMGFLIGNDRHAQLVDVAVHPRSRCHGIGRCIVSKLVAHAHQNEIPFVGLQRDSADPWLTGFFESEGFSGVDFAMIHAGLADSPSYRLDTPVLPVPGVIVGRDRDVQPSEITALRNSVGWTSAESTFHGGAQSLAILMSSLGVGATAGGLLAARGHGRSRVGVEGAAGLFGVALILAAVAPSVALEAVALALVGLASVTFQTTTSTALQVGTDPEYRGRVMALWLVAFVGTTPLGGPATGFIAQLLGIRASVAIAGASCFLAAGIGAAILRRNLDRIGGARDDRVLGSPAVPGCNTAERPKDIAT